MIGAIVGDIVGSIYEFSNIKTKDFKLFQSKCFPTDDTVLTLAISKAILDCKRESEANGQNFINYYNLSKYAVKRMQKYGRMYPNAGYGGRFRLWLNQSFPQAYGSYGNGAAMRVSPCAYVATSMDELKEIVKKVTVITHDHPEGLKGAEATAVATYMAIHKASKVEIRNEIVFNYYPLDFKLDDIRTSYEFDESCQGTVPQAIEAFLESTSFEDAIRNAISIGGDSDTIAAITGSIAGAFYGVPRDIEEEAESFLTQHQLEVYEEFVREFHLNERD